MYPLHALMIQLKHSSGGTLSPMKMPFIQFRDPHGNPHTWETRSLYWDGAQLVTLLLAYYSNQTMGSIPVHLHSRNTVAEDLTANINGRPHVAHVIRQFRQVVFYHGPLSQRVSSTGKMPKAQLIRFRIQNTLVSYCSAILSCNIWPAFYRDHLIVIWRGWITYWM